MSVTNEPLGQPPIPLAPQFPKKKTTAVLLAVFLTIWTWAYTYKVDAWKFWLNLALGILTLGVWTVFISWPWSIIDAARRPQGWYESFPNGDALRLSSSAQPASTTAVLPPPAPAPIAFATPEVSHSNPETATPAGSTTAAAAAAASATDTSPRALGTKQLGIYAAACVALIVFLAVITSGSADEPTAPANVPSAPASLPPVDLTIDSPADGRTVKKKKTTLRGTVMAGATITASTNGGDVRVVRVKSNGAWAATQPLVIGDNSLTVSASAPGRSDAEASVLVTRKHSQAELAAIKARREAAQRKRAAAREAARQKRAAAKAAFESDYKANAKSISYKQLEKGADDYSGKRVVFRGQVFQIQESGGFGYMLLSVTDLGYDLWTDNVWVNFNRSTKFVEDDIVTVWGPIDGSKSYETQIGGETFVPEMTAKYLSAG
jgi:hypothetical protein